MSDLLPSSPDTSAADEADPRVVGLESDDADDLLSALSSATARKLLAALHEEPSTPSAVADRIDTSLQNAQYHLKKLEDADIIEVIDTVYSEKGREMKVYAPTSQPLVVFAGDEESSSGLKSALSRLLGALGAVGVASVIVQSLFGEGGLLVGDGGESGGGAPVPAGGDGGTSGTGTQAGQAPAQGTPEPGSGGAVEATAQAAGQAADAAAATLPPGLVFFAGGAAVLLVGFAVWHVRR
jgi:DNA-binding transcriptional ArsR family regulator